MEDFSYLRHLKDRNDMNPVAVRLLNQQLVAPQFSDPAEVVSYMGAIQAQEYRMMRWAVAMRTDIDFKGCKSSFACKIKNSKTNGVCALKDDLRPVLERCRQADIIVIGSPVYYSYPTGEIRSFMERLMFPVGTYMYENGKHITLRDKVIPTAIIFTMNCPEDYMKQIGYPPILEENTKVMADIFGYSETLYVCNTYQFNDYSRYDFNLFSEEDKRKYRDEHFDTDLKNAIMSLIV